MEYNVNLHIEVKKDGQWHHLSAPALYESSVDDNGRFVDLIAGIYNADRVVRPLRGLPKDRTFVTDFALKQAARDGDVHHMGYLTADELNAVQDALFAYYEDLKNRGRSDVPSSKYAFDLELAYFHTAIEGWDDMRLVFWFKD